MDNLNISICDLSGALTLPLVSSLFGKDDDISNVYSRFQQLKLLYDNRCYDLAFKELCTQFREAGVTLPPIFCAIIQTETDKQSFVGEVLTDFAEILKELT